MIPNVAQSIDDIIKNATPEQKILWQQIRMITGENASIRQYYYFGGIAGHEVLTYSANRLFLAFELQFAGGSINNSITNISVDLFNEANVLSFSTAETSGLWDATAAMRTQIAQNLFIPNCYFSRIINHNIGYMKLNGFKITY